MRGLGKREGRNEKGKERNRKETQKRGIRKREGRNRNEREKREIREKWDREGRAIEELERHRRE